MDGQQETTGGERLRPETTGGHYALEVFGIAAFFLLAVLMGVEVYGGMAGSGLAWRVERDGSLNEQ